jgi:hypothetical protein
VFAPLYHQITIGTYLDPSAEMLLDAAYEEIADAFDHYLAQYNDGRDFVLIGHSQGSHLLRRLVQRKIDHDDALREQMALAILVGPLGDITVPAGEVVGGSFDNVPVCQTADERSCLITYSSYPADMPPAAIGVFFGGVPDGMDTPCTNPVGLAGGNALSSGTYMPTTPAAVTTGTLTNLADELDVTTDLAVYRDFYSLECVQNAAGHSYLAVSVDASSNDQRVDPILYDSSELFVALVGLHIFDFSFALEDLVELVGAHAR